MGLINAETLAKLERAVVALEKIAENLERIQVAEGACPSVYMNEHMNHQSFHSCELGGGHDYWHYAKGAGRWDDEHAYKGETL